MTRWLSIVGIGDDGLDGLAPVARAAIEQAEVLVGGKRHLSMLPPDGREHLVWSSPFDSNFAQLDNYRGRPVCVLASGDPNCHGAGTKLVEKLPSFIFQGHHISNNHRCTKLSMALKTFVTCSGLHHDITSRF